MQCLGDAVEPTRRSSSYGAMMVRFEEFLAANSDRPVYLAEICAALGVSERTAPQGSLDALASGIFLSDSL